MGALKRAAVNISSVSIDGGEVLASHVLSCVGSHARAAEIGRITRRIPVNLVGRAHQMWHREVGGEVQLVEVNHDLLYRLGALPLVGVVNFDDQRLLWESEAHAAAAVHRHIVADESVIVESLMACRVVIVITRVLRQKNRSSRRAVACSRAAISPAATDRPRATAPKQQRGPCVTS